jgi:hypothetical protein
LKEEKRSLMLKKDEYLCTIKFSFTLGKIQKKIMSGKKGG